MDNATFPKAPSTTPHGRTALVSLPADERTQSNEQLLADDAQFVMRPWTAAGEPLPIVEAHGSYVRDADGRVYMDFTSGYFVNQAGHSHPRVISAAIAQLHKVSQVSGRHASEPAIGMAKELARLAPGRLSKTLYTTGGCESTEFALKMARQKSGKPGVMVLDNAFHGLSVQALAACSNESYRKSASVPLDPNFVSAPTPYVYRWKNPDACVDESIAALEAILDANPHVGTILAEPMQAVGGLAPPLEWWQRVDAIRKARGLVLILDEIQTGLGRTGKMWGADHYGLEADIMTLAKGLSGGVGSLGAVMATPEIASSFWGATSPTSAANAISCAAGLEMIRVIQDEKLVDNAAAMGEYMTRVFWDLRSPFIGDVRFKGLLGGVELVLDRKTKQPWTKDQILGMKADLLERGVICTATGPLGNVIRIQPPLSVSPSEIDRFVSHFDAAVRVAMHAAGRASA
jgi:4-aminobutyrate aminotransferase-like enzyme